MVIILEFLIIAAFAIVAVCMFRRPAHVDAPTSDDISELNARVGTLEQIVIEKDRDWGDGMDGHV